MLVSYEPDFGYEERIDFSELNKAPASDDSPPRPTTWQVLLDIISRYPRFERVLNVLEKLKEEKARNPPRRKAKRVMPTKEGGEASLSNIYFENEAQPSREEQRLRNIRFDFEDFQKQQDEHRRWLLILKKKMRHQLTEDDFAFL